MIKYFYLILLILFVSCAEQVEEPKQIIVNNTISVKENVIPEDTILVNRGLNIEMQDDSLFFKNNDSVIVEEFLQPKQWVDEKAGVYKLDEAKIVANCLVIYRGLEKGGPELCGTLPRFDELEIYTKEGKHINYGSKHNQSFFGGYPSENAAWVVLNYEAEGEYGDWKILQEDGKITEIASYIELGYAINFGTLETINDTTKIIKNVALGLKHQGTDLTIYRNGNYKAEFHLDSSDQAILYAFPHHETSQKQLPDQSYWGVGTNENGEFYVDVVHKRIYDKGIVSGDAMFQPMFYFTGISTCIQKGNTIKANSKIRSINREETLSINLTTQLVLEKEHVVSIQDGEKTILFSIDKNHPDYKLIDEVIIYWSADLNCDGSEELLMQYDLGNTNYKRLIGADVNGKYQLLAVDALYWD